MRQPIMIGETIVGWLDGSGTGQLTSTVEVYDGRAHICLDDDARPDVVIEVVLDPTVLQAAAVAAANEALGGAREPIPSAKPPTRTVEDTLRTRLSTQRSRAQIRSEFKVRSVPNPENSQQSGD